MDSETKINNDIYVKDTRNYISFSETQEALIQIRMKMRGIKKVEG